MTIGGISIVTVLVSKLKFDVKTNGSLNWGVGCQDKPLVDDDEIEVKTVELGDVHVMYAKINIPLRGLTLKVKVMRNSNNK